LHGDAKVGQLNCPVLFLLLSAGVSLFLGGACSRKVDLRTDRAELIKSMSDSDMETAYAAVKRLAELHGEAGLIEALKEDSSDTKGLAALELRAYPTLRSKDALIELLSDADPSVRAKALDSLGHVCDDRCKPVLEAQAASDPDMFVREMAAQALKRIKPR
jgi:HEAT repeat protein